LSLRADAYLSDVSQVCLTSCDGYWCRQNFFPGVTAVSIHGIACANVTILDKVSMTVLQCTAPAGCGAGTLMVTIDRGSASIAFAYPPPLVTDLSLTVADAEGTDRIQIRGRDLAVNGGADIPVVWTGTRRVF
jgi:hypothetical protein